MLSIIGGGLLKQAMAPKNWLYAAGLILIIYLSHLGFSWIWDRGYDKRTAETSKEISDLKTERDTAVNNYNTYKGTYDEWVKNTKFAQEKYLAEQKLDLEKRQERLAVAEATARNKPTKIKEVIKYVPAQVDAIYRLPVGFIRLYRDTIEGTAALDQRFGVPQGITFDVGEASPITMSQFGQLAGSNNAECVLRGKVIEEWQGYYKTNEAAFEKFRTWQIENAPKPSN
jgi:hypothetical protein